MYSPSCCFDYIYIYTFYLFIYFKKFRLKQIHSCTWITCLTMFWGFIISHDFLRTGHKSRFRAIIWQTAYYFQSQKERISGSLITHIHASIQFKGISIGVFLFSSLVNFHPMLIFLGFLNSQKKKFNLFSLPESLFKFLQVSQKCWSMLSLFYFHIINQLMDDCHFSCITKLEKLKIPISTSSFQISS